MSAEPYTQTDGNSDAPDRPKHLDGQEVRCLGSNGFPFAGPTALEGARRVYLDGLGFQGTPGHAAGWDAAVEHLMGGAATDV